MSTILPDSSNNLNPNLSAAPTNGESAGPPIDVTPTPWFRALASSATRDQDRWLGTLTDVGTGYDKLVWYGRAHTKKAALEAAEDVAHQLCQRPCRTGSYLAEKHREQLAAERRETLLARRAALKARVVNRNGATSNTAQEG